MTAPTARLLAILLSSADAWQRLATAYGNERWAAAARWRREMARAIGEGL